MFTGSGMPMRFADLNGSMIDVYQAATQMTDESGQSYPFTIDTLLNRALGPEGYYGVFTANMHTDNAESSGSDAIVASAQARGVPIVSARQMLTWLDGRNDSSFGSVKWSANKLEFTIDHAAGANGLRAMVPTTSSVGALTGVKLNGSPVTTISRTIKGREYAFFDAAPGSYEAIYAVDETAPAISAVASSVSGSSSATITWDTNEAADSKVDYGTNPDTLTASQSGSTLVTSHSVQLTGLKPTATYYYRVSSQDAAGNSSTDPVPPAAPRKFTTSPLTFEDTTVSDFSAGSPDSSTRGLADQRRRVDPEADRGGGVLRRPGPARGLGLLPMDQPRKLHVRWGRCFGRKSPRRRHLCPDDRRLRVGSLARIRRQLRRPELRACRLRRGSQQLAELGDLQCHRKRRLLCTHQQQRDVNGNAALERSARLASPLPDRVGRERRSLLRRTGRWSRPTRQISAERRCVRSQAISPPGARNSRSTGSI